MNAIVTTERAANDWTLRCAGRTGQSAPGRAPLAAPIEPKQLPEIRAEIVDWLQRYDNVSAHWASITPPYNEAGMYADAQRNARFLRQGDLYFVSRQMADEVLTAAAEMPGYFLRLDDPPAPSGLVVWERPVNEPRELNLLIGAPVIAASWGPHPAGVEVRFWVHQEDWIADTINAQERGDGRTLGPAEVAAARKSMRRDLPSRLIPATATVLCPGEQATWPSSALRRRDLVSPVHVDDETIMAVAMAVASEQALVATWKLMRQEIAVQEPVEPERAARKRIARISPQLPTEVRIVSLRRPAPALGASTAAGAGRKGRVYTHREDVRPHWRNVYCPSTGDHDRKWIAAYERGPVGAPKRQAAPLVSVLRR